MTRIIMDKLLTRMNWYSDSWKISRIYTKTMHKRLPFCGVFAHQTAKTPFFVTIQSYNNMGGYSS